ncbi:hypothetical protein BaRGS_00003683 [Batillaria attramentaria]|uniref:C1q domain-containing protein n=1 Tax=Batillaria attramentaria TaxID=370345 RepID=A0ABD0M1E0_9CAEN
MKRVVLLVLVVVHVLVSASGDVRRSDPVSGGGSGGSVHTAPSGALEKLIQEQAAIIQNLQARLDAQDQSLAAYASRIDALEKANQNVAFFTDFGRQPFGEVHITQDVPLVYNRLLLNDGQAYDNLTGIFTAPSAGLYSFTLHIMAPDAAERGTVEVGIFTNSTDLPRAVAVSEGGRDSNDQGSCTAVLHLAQGDKVFTKWNAGDEFLWGSYFTSFMGVLLHAD